MKPFEKFSSSLFLLFSMFFIFATRLLPHPPNVSPVLAIGLLAQVFLKDKVLKIFVPLIALFLSDLFLGFYPGALFVYGSYALIFFLSSFFLPARNTFVRVLPLSLLGSTLFFFVSNFGVWSSTEMYPHSWNGLLQCYAAALPFFRNTLSGDAFFTLVFFASFEIFRLWKMASPSPLNSAAKNDQDASE